MHKHTIRRLPIVDHDKLVGVVTSRDIFAELDKHPARPPTQPRSRSTTRASGAEKRPLMVRRAKSGKKPRSPRRK
jgi:CBS-domain-containing membrane protein